MYMRSRLLYGRFILFIMVRGSEKCSILFGIAASSGNAALVIIGDD